MMKATICIGPHTTDVNKGMLTASFRSVLKVAVTMVGHFKLVCPAGMVFM